MTWRRKLSSRKRLGQCTGRNTQVLRSRPHGALVFALWLRMEQKRQSPPGKAIKGHAKACEPPQDCLAQVSSTTELTSRLTDERASCYYDGSNARDMRLQPDQVDLSAGRVDKQGDASRWVRKLNPRRHAPHRCQVFDAFH